MATTSNVLSSKSIRHASPRTKLTGMPAHFSFPFSNILSERSSATISRQLPKPAYISLANAPSRVATSSAFPIWSGESSCRSLSMRDPSCYSVNYNGKCLIRQCLPPQESRRFSLYRRAAEFASMNLPNCVFLQLLRTARRSAADMCIFSRIFIDFPFFLFFSKKGLHFSDGCAILFSEENNSPPRISSLLLFS